MSNLPGEENANKIKLEQIIFVPPKNGFKSRRHVGKVYLKSVKITSYREGYRLDIETRDNRLIKAYADEKPDFSLSKVWWLRSVYKGKIILLSRPGWVKIELKEMD